MLKHHCVETAVSGRAEVAMGTTHEIAIVVK